MRHPRQELVHFAVIIAAILAASQFAEAQAYPTRPITLVVPYASGGAIDVTARIVAEQMKAVIGQPIVIENVTGAGGSIGVGRVARAAPDGYTLSFSQNGSHVLTGAMYPLQYDLLNDFQPIALVATSSMLILARKGMPADNLKDLIAWLKANPNRAVMGTAGAGSLSHLTGVFFQMVTGTEFGFVPYRGAAPGLQDLVAGQIDLMMPDTTASLALLRAGAIKVYGVTSGVRLSSAAEILTVDEAGLPGFHVSLWQGVWAPARTPNNIISKLNAAVIEAMRDPGVRARLRDLGQDFFPAEQQTPEALHDLQKAEIEKWWPIIKAAGIKGE